MKRGILLSYILLFAGFATISFTVGSSITGNAVLGSTGSSIVSVIGIALVGCAVGLFFAEGGLEEKFVDVDPSTKSIRRKAEKTARKYGEKPNLNSENYHSETARIWNKYKDRFGDKNKEGLKKPKSLIGPKIYVSNEAMERALDDKTIFNNFIKYQEEIDRIARYAKQGHYKGSRIGDFRVAPKGRDPKGEKKPRIAWKYDEKKDELKIFDMLYHINDKDYTDFWNIEAANNRIKKDDYTFEDKETTTKELGEIVKKAA